MDLYDLGDRLQTFPAESGRMRGEDVPAEMTNEPRGAAKGRPQRDLEEEEVDELVHLYGLEDDDELSDEIVNENTPRIEVSEYSPHMTGRGGPATPQRGWRLGAEAAEADGLGFGGWGSEGRHQDLREAYRYTHGRASEEYECYVIPEEEDEEEAADVFCATCKTPLRAAEKVLEEHREHEVTPLSKALESAKDEIHRNMDRLEKQIIEMESFASHLEEVFITVEENFGRQEQNFESHYNEILETLAQKYEEKVRALGERKREKLEALYAQLVSCGENLDTCKELMEAVEEVCHEEKAAFIKDAVAMADRLREFLQTETDVDISAQPALEDQTLDFSDVEQLLGSINAIPAPSAPVMSPQAPNSASGSSVRVCWSLRSDDTVESYQLSCRPARDGTPGEDQAEFTMTVKETYCSVRNLVPNTQYEFWVTAQNRAGVSPASERAVYMTGSCFRLDVHTCHPWLAISEDGLTAVRSERRAPTREPPPSNTRFTSCVAAMGNLVPVRGRHYWEVEVDERSDYTVGVAFDDVPKQEDLGANCQSWCMRHAWAPPRHKYEFLHNKTTPDIRITVSPKKIGILLDYENSKLSFFNVDISQHLYTFRCQLHRFVQPCFSLEKPGRLKVHNGIATPEHVALY
ncbi:fibronectin type III and SPRY domain-containing protein 2 isoform 2-T2 [Glossophaga mutica]